MTDGGIPAVLMRGGTSKGLFLHAHDLPPAGPARDALVLDLMGSPDPMQIDGLGGTYSSTSKVVVVEAGLDETVTYWFGQVGIETATVDWSGNCGNLTTAVGPFAIDEGLVPAVEPVTRVHLVNANTNVRIDSDVPVCDGRARTDGEHWIAGVPRPGAPVITRYLDPAGSVTGSLLPTGQTVDLVDTPFGVFEVSIVDVTHPYVFVPARALGVTLGATAVGNLNADSGLLERLEAVRAAAAVLIGAVDDATTAAHSSPIVPRMVMVGPPRDPSTTAFDALAVSMGKIHRALPMTAALCGAAAAHITSTVVNACAHAPDSAVPIAHPLGAADVLVDADTHAGQPVIRSVGVVRTARRLMAGIAYPYANHQMASHEDA